MIATEKRSAPRSATVRLIPSIAIDPLPTTYRSIPSGRSNSKTQSSPTRSIPVISVVVST